MAKLSKISGSVKNLVFLRMSSMAKQKLVGDLLDDQYDILIKDNDLKKAGVALLILDYTMFNQRYEEVVKAKKAAGNTYLPVMVLIPRGKAGTDLMWEVADDVVEMSVSKKNLATRVRGLIKMDLQESLWVNKYEFTFQLKDNESDIRII